MANTDDTFDWKNLYDMLTKKYQSLEKSLKEKEYALQRVKNEEATKGRKEILRNIIPILDDMDKLNEAIINSNTDKTIIDAVKLIIASFNKFFIKEDVISLDIEPGMPFDPKYHEAFSTMPSEIIEKNCIIKILQKGFLFNNSLLRAAKVIVSSGKG